MRRGPAAALIVLLTVTTAHADPSVQDQGIAESLFREGREAMKAGDLARACPKLEESYRLDPSPGALVNLAICEARLGKTASAWTKLRGFEEVAQKDDPRLPLVRRELHDLRPRLSFLRVTLVGVLPGAVVRLDATELRSPSLGADFPVDPGRHEVSVTTPEGTATKQTIEVTEGARMEVELRPPSLPVAELPAERVAKPTVAPVARGPLSPSSKQTASSSGTGDRHGYRLAGYVSGAVGVAGAIAGGIFLGLAGGEKDVVDSSCPGHVCSPAGLEAVDNGARYLRFADVCGVVAVLGLTLGGGLVWYGSQQPVRVHASTSGGSVAFEGTF